MVGYSFGPRVVITAKIVEGATVFVGDILVRDQSGLYRRWSDKHDIVVGIALEGLEKAEPGSRVQIVVALPHTVCVYPSPGIEDTDCFRTCDIGGPQQIDHSSNRFNNVWIVEVDEAMDLAYVMFKGPFGSNDKGEIINY